MYDLVKSWYQRTFTDPQAAILAVLLVLGFTLIIFFGRMLAPLLASVVIAYLLEGPVRFLQVRKIPRLAAVLIVFIGFTSSLVLLTVGLIPVLTTQLSQFFQELPSMVQALQNALMTLQQSYPYYLSEEQVGEWLSDMRQELAAYGQRALSVSLASIPALITWLVYLILVPIIVFFMMKDKETMLQWCGRYLPKKDTLAARVWQEMDMQIGNYVRGKLFEIVIVGAVTYVAFAVLGLDYAMLLAALVGISVLIPYIGAAVVTLPVVLVAYFQFGFGDQFWQILIAYTIIQTLDGSVLVPVLFSEAVNLHPVAIIVAVLVFGGIWGFWGVFFAIPLATLVKAVLNAWPRSVQEGY